MGVVETIDSEERVGEESQEGMVSVCSCTVLFCLCMRCSV